MTRLRIASYNTRDLLDDRAAAARVVRALDPDVLCLQEVPRRLFAATRVARFAHESGMVWSGHHRGSGGTTIFTARRVEATQVWHRRLQVRPPDRTRGYAVVSVTAAAALPLVVASVHLSLRAAERERHTQAILASLGRTDRTVVCGDLNEDETGGAWRLLADGMRLVSPPHPTYPSYLPRRRLDVVFATPDVAVLPHAPVGLALEDLAAGSDHRPIWVDVEV